MFKENFVATAGLGDRATDPFALNTHGKQARLQRNKLAMRRPFAKGFQAPLR